MEQSRVARQLSNLVYFTFPSSVRQERFLGVVLCNSFFIIEDAEMRLEIRMTSKYSKEHQ